MKAAITTVARADFRVRNMNVGKPQRQYVVEPREIPVPAPARQEPTPALPEPVPEQPELEPAAA